MSGLHLYTSNRIEHLIPIIGSVISSQRKSLFRPETIVVQNKGMAQWLSLKIADHLKICAFCDFPFPTSFFQSLFSTVFPDLPETLPFDPDILLWRVYQELPGLLSSNEFATFKPYLNSNDSLKLYYTSKKIAEIFDQYSMYRPEMIQTWENSPENSWQSILWRKLLNSPISHRAQVRELFIKKLKEGTISDLIPERVCFFGISSLPPFFTDLIGILSDYIDIHYFLLNPCTEFWDDIVSEKDVIRYTSKRKRVFKKTVDVQSLHFDQGNSLLASLGTYGRDFISRLHDLDCDENSIPVSVERHHLLTSIQSDILHLSTPKTTEEKEISLKDTSVQIHSCHSQQREIEALYDNLLHLFDSLPGLTPSDVIVMAPDIEQYVPHIKAIFGASNNNKLPFSLADQTMKMSSTLLNGFLQLMEIVNSRFTSVAVLDLLEIDEVREKFELSIEDIKLIKEWIKSAGIRWSIDGVSKKQLSIPETSENSWKSGLDQLLLGFALPSTGNLLFDGIAGNPLIEGANSAILGKFIDFYNCLVEFNSKCQDQHTLKEWANILLNIFDQMFITNILNQQSIIDITRIISSLSVKIKQLEFEVIIPFDIIKVYLQQQFTSSRASQGFLNGNITFCSIMPMRGIPFRVICLLGLNDDAFPRKAYHLSWDLIAAFPKKGDRSIEIEDRYIFLESLLSARDVFYISYIGNSIQKNVTLHPSVCVEELIDYIEKNYEISTDSKFESNKPDNKKQIVDHIISDHKLHPFNPEYFMRDCKLFSYSPENLAGAQKLQTDKIIPLPFFSESLSTPPNEFRQLTIDSLIAFFLNPSKFILQKRLGIIFKQPEEEILDTESFDLNGLVKYELANDLTRRKLLLPGETTDWYQFYKASNMLPHGEIGQIIFNELNADVSGFIKKIDEFAQTNSPENLPFSITIDDFTIQGQLTSLYPEYMLLYRNADIKANDYLRTWIMHICLNCIKSNHYSTILITKDELKKFSPLDHAIAIMKSLLAFYYNGLSSPLRLFPQTSWIYASTILKAQKSAEIALSKAYKLWTDQNEYSRSREANDLYINYCFQEKNPLNSDFEKVALDIYSPILKHCSTLDG